VRRDVSCAPYKWAWNAENGRMEQVFTDWRTIYVGKWNRLWMKTQQGPDAQYSTGINFPIIRYADVLLMLAESENEIYNSPTDDARKALKEVRRRAFPSDKWDIKVDQYVDDIANYDDFFLALRNERAWEFAGESIRKYDLIRWNRLQSDILMMLSDLDNMCANASYPQYIYTKTRDDGTLDILNFDNTVTTTPSGYTKRNWAINILGGDHTTYEKSYKSEYVGANPMSYIFPLYKDVITDSRGMLRNYYGKQ
jgi:hypothetical protein